jgi:hypothetical protein
MASMTAVESADSRRSRSTKSLASPEPGASHTCGARARRSRPRASRPSVRRPAAPAQVGQPGGAQQRTARLMLPHTSGARGRRRCDCKGPAPGPGASRASSAGMQTHVWSGADVQARRPAAARRVRQRARAPLALRAAQRLQVRARRLAWQDSQRAQCHLVSAFAGLNTGQPARAYMMPRAAYMVPRTAYMMPSTATSSAVKNAHLLALCWLASNAAASSPRAVAVRAGAAGAGPARAGATSSSTDARSGATRHARRARLSGAVVSSRTLCRLRSRLASGLRRARSLLRQAGSAAARGGGRREAQHQLHGSPAAPVKHLSISGTAEHKRAKREARKGDAALFHTHYEQEGDLFEDTSRARGQRMN